MLVCTWKQNRGRHLVRRKTNSWLFLLLEGKLIKVSGIAVDILVANFKINCILLSNGGG